MVESPKVIVAHPGAQHSARLAMALKRAGLLDRYVTTVYPSAGSITQFATRFLPRGDRDRARARKIDLDDSEVVLLCEAIGLIILALQKFEPLAPIVGSLRRFNSWVFQIRLAHLVRKRQVDAVVLYDTNAYTTSRILERRAPQVLRIIDHAHAVRNFAFEVLAGLGDSDQELGRTVARMDWLKSRSKAAKYGVECRKGNFHIVASQFSKESVVFNGVSADNVAVIPYGVDHSLFHPAGDRSPNGKLRCLYVSRLSLRKGLRQVLDLAVRLQDEVEVSVVGGDAEVTRTMLEDYSGLVHFTGELQSRQLADEYRSSDIFLFPTLCDGFGLVLLEALASGLPVVSSMNCAGPDIIEDGVDGFVVEANDTEAFIDRVLWLHRNRERLLEMSRNAREKSLQYSWDRYATSVSRVMSRWLSNSGGPPTGRT